MEITFKVILDKRRPKNNNTYPLKMRVYQGRVYKTHSLGIDLREKDWNEQTQQVRSINPNHKLHNAKIATLKAKVQKSIFMNDEEKEAVTPDDILLLVTKKGANKHALTDILAYGKQHVKNLEMSGQVGNSLVYICAINKLKKYANKECLLFEEVNYSFVEKFNSTMLAEGMKVNAISNYLRTIRALFNKAIREGVISADCYPFSKFRIKSESTINRSLTIEELQSIIALELHAGSKAWHYRNLFLLSYCLIGVNFADLLTLKTENFVDGRVIFRRKKTHKVYSILLHPKAQEIFSCYLTGKSVDRNDFLLPFVNNKNNPAVVKKDILQAIRNTNDYLDNIAKLCKINKPITTYYARYCWANAARNLGYSKDLIAEALGHEYGNKVTGIYLDNYSNTIIDDMNAKVIEHSFDLQ